MQPGSGGAQAPDCYFLARSQQARKNHEPETNNPKSEASSASTAGPRRRAGGVCDIDKCCPDQNDQRSDKPFPVCGVNQQVETRFPASCPETINPLATCPPTAATIRQKIGADSPGARRRAGRHTHNWVPQTPNTGRRTSPSV